jgi:hypothetical protein
VFGRNTELIDFHHECRLGLLGHGFGKGVHRDTERKITAEEIKINLTGLKALKRPFLTKPVKLQPWYLSPNLSRRVLRGLLGDHSHFSAKDPHGGVSDISR